MSCPCAWAEQSEAGLYNFQVSTAPLHSSGCTLASSCRALQQGRCHLRGDVAPHCKAVAVLHKNHTLCLCLFLLYLFASLSPRQARRGRLRERSGSPATGTPGAFGFESTSQRWRRRQARYVEKISVSGTRVKRLSDPSLAPPAQGAAQHLARAAATYHGAPASEQHSQVVLRARGTHGDPVRGRPVPW